MKQTLSLSFGIFCLSLTTQVNAKKDPTIYQYIQSNGVIAFTDRKPVEHSYTVYRTGCYACSVRSQLNWHKMPLYTNKFAAEIGQASKEYNIDPALLRAVIHAESSFRANIRSKKGAIGLMQLMPGTAAELGIKNPKNAGQNIRGGAKYMAKLLAKFRGNIRLATAAYNAGPGAVSRHKGIPPFAETKAYVERVGILHNRYRLALNSTT